MLSKLKSKLDTALIWAIKTEQTDLAGLLAKCGLSVNTCDKYGKSLLYLAVQTGNLQLIRLLLRSGADPNICDRFGETPLHFVAKWGDAAITAVLLQNGADPNFAAADAVVKPPFWTAVEYQQENIIAQMLQGCNVNVNYVNKYGVSLIEYVVTQKNEKITAMIQNYIRLMAFKALYVARAYDEDCIVYSEYLCDDLFKLLLSSILL